jgi:hypothetical protein
MQEANLEDGAIVLKCLEPKILGDPDSDHIHGANMLPPSTSRFPNVRVLPLASQHPAFRGGHVVVGHVS